jgi:hypothetical protein
MMEGKTLDTYLRDWYWKLLPGKTVCIRYPEPHTYGHKIMEWLNEHVGRQGIDWAHRFHRQGAGFDLIYDLEIKFRPGKGKYATMFRLKWS